MCWWRGGVYWIPGSFGKGMGDGFVIGGALAEIVVEVDLMGSI